MKCEIIWAMETYDMADYIMELHPRLLFYLQLGRDGTEYSVSCKARDDAVVHFPSFLHHVESSCIEVPCDILGIKHERYASIGT